MKNFIIKTVFVFGFFYLLNGYALASGYSTAILVDNIVMVSMFNDSKFTLQEVNMISEYLRKNVESEVEAVVLYHNDLGSADFLKQTLPYLTRFYDILFVDITKGSSPIFEDSVNIWMHFWHENTGDYIASVSFPEQYSDLFFQSLF